MLNIPAWNIDLSLLSFFFEASEASKLGFTVDEIQRRMAIVGSAGVTDEEDFKRFVLSPDAA